MLKAANYWQILGNYTMNIDKFDIRRYDFKSMIWPLTAVLLLLWSCHRPHPSISQSHPPASQILASEIEDARLLPQKNVYPGGTLYLASPRPPTSFLSYVNSFSPTNEQITHQILLPLLERHPLDDTVRSSLAESWTISEDGKILRFKLRNDHYWSDGMPITSDDVLFTFQKIILNPDSPGNYLEVFSDQGRIVEVIEIDDKTVDMHLPILLPAIPYALTYLPILPSHKITVDQVSPDHLPSLWSTATNFDSIVSSGPFILKEYEPDRKVVLEKNPYFFRTDAQGNRLPYVQNLELIIVPTPAQRIAMFLAKKLDFLQPSPEDFLLLQSQEKKKKSFTTFHGVAAKSSPSVAHIAFNFDVADPEKAKIFRQLNFRIAMEHLLNRPLIIKQVYRGFANIQGTFILPSNHAFYDAISDTMRRPYNRGLAINMLDNLGITDKNKDGWRQLPNGQPLQLTINAGLATQTQKEQEIALLFVMELQEVGINAVLEPLPAAALAAKIDQADFDIVVRSIANSPDPGVRVRVVWEPGQFMYYFHPKTYDRATNSPVLKEMMPWEKELMQLYTLGNTTDNPAQRAEYYARVQRIYAEDLPVIFTVRQDNLYAAQNTLHNVYLSEEGLLAFSTWTVGQSKTR